MIKLHAANDSPAAVAMSLRARDMLEDSLSPMGPIANPASAAGEQTVGERGDRMAGSTNIVRREENHGPRLRTDRLARRTRAGMLRHLSLESLQCQNRASLARTA